MTSRERLKSVTTVGLGLWFCCLVTCVSQENRDTEGDTCGPVALAAMGSCQRPTRSQLMTNRLSPPLSCCVWRQHRPRPVTPALPRPALLRDVSRVMLRAGPRCQLCPSGPSQQARSRGLHRGVASVGKNRLPEQQAPCPEEGSQQAPSPPSQPWSSHSPTKSQTPGLRVTWDHGERRTSCLLSQPRPQGPESRWPETRSLKRPRPFLTAVTAR